MLACCSRLHDLRRGWRPLGAFNRFLPRKATDGHGKRQQHCFAGCHWRPRTDTDKGRKRARLERGSPPFQFFFGRVRVPPRPSVANPHRARVGGDTGSLLATGLPAASSALLFATEDHGRHGQGPEEGAHRDGVVPPFQLLLAVFRVPPRPSVANQIEPPGIADEHASSAKVLPANGLSQSLPRLRPGHARPEPIRRWCRIRGPQRRPPALALRGESKAAPRPVDCISQPFARERRTPHLGSHRERPALPHDRRRCAPPRAAGCRARSLT